MNVLLALVTCCVAPVVVGLWRLARSGELLDELRVQLHRYGGGVLADVVSRPRTRSQRQRLFAMILHAANEAGILVQEAVAMNGPPHTIQVWYGGRPLMAPGDDNERRALTTLQAFGSQVDGTPDEVRITTRRSASPLVGWILLLLLLPFLPVLIFFTPGRRWLRIAWDEAHGRALRQRVEIRPEGLTLFDMRDELIREREELPATELLGISEIDASGGSCVRLVSRGRTLEIDSISSASAVAEALRATLLRLWRERPELGFLGKGPAPAHCPFCRTLYVMEPASRCPQCGAPTGTFPSAALR